jgi:integrase
MDRHLNVYAKSLHQMAVKSVTQPHVAALLEELRTERGDSVADHTRASLSAFFTWAAKSGCLGVTPSNPVSYTLKSKPIERDRVLTLDEIKAIWKATAANTSYNKIIRLLMLTGQRRDEIGSLDRNEIDISKALICFPRDRMGKADDTHDLPMTGAVLEILNSIPIIEVDGAPGSLFFGTGKAPKEPTNSTTRKNLGFTGWSQSKLRLDKRIEKLLGKPIEPWRLHDLRHTLSTKMREELMIPPHVVEAVLHHTSSEESGKKGVAGVYNHAKHTTEMRDALNVWTDYILREVAGT